MISNRSIILSCLTLLLILVVAACSGPYRDDARLQRVALALDNPEISQKEALGLRDNLITIPDRELSEGERHYRDFLIIKAADKGYATHTSDSLYLTVKDYFSSHHKEMLPEVLYYGGRVYSDIGNSPVALQHFQSALDHMAEPSTPKEIRLTRTTLSQTGRLLSGIGLHDEASRYLEKCLEIGNKLKDTINQIYNLELAGDISTRIKDLHKARKYFADACRLSRDKYPSEYSVNRFREGYTLYLQGDMEDGLKIIRETVDSVKGMSKNFALPIVAQAYLKTGDLDGARYYASELIALSDPLNREIGYYVMLSDSIRSQLSADTISRYFKEYNKVLEKQRDRSMEESAIIQNTFYNYTLHDRARLKAEKERDVMRMWLLVILIVALIGSMSVVVRLLMKEKGKAKYYGSLIRLRILTEINLPRTGGAEATPGGDGMTENAGTVEPSDIHEPSHSGDVIDEGHYMDEIGFQENINTVRERLRDVLTELYEKGQLSHQDAPLPDNLLLSSTYSDLKECVRQGINVENDKELWSRVEGMVQESFPHFLRRLRLLTDRRLTEQEEQTAILVKCGFR